MSTPGYANALFAKVTAGNPVTLPAGFVFASFNPESSSTYTVTSNIGGDRPPILQVSPTLTGVISLPDLGNFGTGWDTHIITLVSGTAVDIMFVTGN